MYVMSIMRHNPESCAAFNEATRKATQAAIGQMDALTAKHGIKLAGFWNDLAGHAVYSIFDTPSLDTYFAFVNEPEMVALLATNTCELKPVLSLEETAAMALGG